LDRAGDSQQVNGGPARHLDQAIRPNTLGAFEMSRPVHLSDTEFDNQVLASDLPVLVDFWAPWCGPCRFVAPVLEELANEYAGRIVVAKVNTDQHQAHAARLGIRGIPTLILFQNGHEVDRVVGALPKPALAQWLDSKLAA
jgi:thioredoxin 1